MKKLAMNITGVFPLHDGFSIYEIKNDLEKTYDYYLYKKRFPLCYVFGALQENGHFEDMEECTFINLYNNGYFNIFIEEYFDGVL